MTAENGEIVELTPALSLKDLDPRDARMALAAARFAGEELGVPLEGHLLVALSGGADSTALLIVMCALRPLLGCRVEAAHLDHCLRPESADDARAAGELCASLGVPFHAERVDVSHLAETIPCGVEEAGRRARYAFLEKTRLSCGASWVLTAHHVDDLAEDMLLRLTRGVAWPGLGGMRGKVDEPGRRILRPLLMQRKGDLADMLKRMGVSWREDISNENRAWKRNRMRSDVLPLFERENPSFCDCVRRLWRNARRDESYWSSFLGHALAAQEDGSILIPGEVLLRWGKAERLRAMAEAVHRMHCGQPLADSLERMDAVWERRHFPRRFTFAGGLEADVSAQGILFRRKRKAW